MIKWQLSACTLLGALIFSACSAQKEAAIEEGPPNVVLIVIDTLRADRLHGARNNQPIMPYLSGLAQRSRQFEDAYAPSSWTKVSMASIFTSLYVDWHQVRYSAVLDDPDSPASDVLSEEHEAIATYLKAHGYSTYGVQTNGNVTAELGFDQGFEHYIYMPGAPAVHVSQMARDLLVNHDPDDPFFLFIQYFDPHTPYTPPAEFSERFGPEPELRGADLKYTGVEFNTYFWDQVNTILGRQEAHTLPDLSPDGKEALLHRYDAECAYADDEVRRLLEPIFRRSPNTIVVIVSDHGEEFWEHGGMGHGYTLFDDQTRVPFFIYGPNVKPKVEKQPVNAISVLPSIAHLAGLPPRPHWQGDNLFAAEERSPAVYLQTYGSWPKDNVNSVAITENQWKYIRDNSDSPRYDPIMLFDRSVDPLEQNNVAEDHPELLERFEAVISEFETAWGTPPPRESASQLNLDRETIENLQAIGYLGGIFDEMDEEVDDSPAAPQEEDDTADDGELPEAE